MGEVTPEHSTQELSLTPIPVSGSFASPERPEMSFLSMEDAATSAGVSIKTIRRWIAQGHLPAYRLAGERLVRIKSADLDALFHRIPTAGQQVAE